jgi:hypothetical protein
VKGNQEMNIWFIRSNGDTLHNNPNTVDYVPGEPPVFPKKEFNYRLKCLDQGFARYGHPNTGDLRLKNPERLAPLSYSFQSIEKRYQTYLRKFSSIKAGDLILIPADKDGGDVHLGIALTVDKKVVVPYIEPRPNAYYYYQDIPKGDWYECAHRINVQWAKTGPQEFSVFPFLANKDNVWILAFSPVTNEDSTIYHEAEKAKLF